MKKLLVISIFSLLGLNCYSQEPTQNYDRVPNIEKLKSIKTILYRTEDTSKSDGRILFRKEFDEEGKLVEKYVYTFSDVVSYDHTTSYKYNPSGNLIEETTIQKILSLDQRDEEFIRDMGDDPINEKAFYTYDESNRLVKKVNYTFGREGYNKGDQPSNTIEYIYDKKGSLVREIGTTPNGRVIYQNYVAVYEYDSADRKIKESQTFTTSSPKSVRTTTYKYGLNGQLIEEKTEGSGAPMSNKHFKYKYDSLGNRTYVLIFSEKENQWIVKKSFSYDEKGNLILVDGDTILNYYENGLIKQELWKSSKSNEAVNFITTYQFY